MKLAIFSESSADEAAIRILADAVTGKPFDHATHCSLRAQGWPSVLNLLSAVYLDLHYKTLADALIVVVDSNGSPLHQGPPGSPCGNRQCRLCLLREAAARAQAAAKPFVGSCAVRVAVGIAAPAIEAWYLCGSSPNVSENAWALGLQSRRPPFTRNQLKKMVYGTDRLSIDMETRHATEAVRRLSRDVAQLERLFPIGFGALAAEIRNWRLP